MGAVAPRDLDAPLGPECQDRAQLRHPRRPTECARAGVDAVQSPKRFNRIMPLLILGQLHHRALCVRVLVTRLQSLSAPLCSRPLEPGMVQEDMRRRGSPSGAGYVPGNPKAAPTYPQESHLRATRTLLWRVAPSGWARGLGKAMPACAGAGLATGEAQSAGGANLIATPVKLACAW